MCVFSLLCRSLPGHLAEAPRAGSRSTSGQRTNCWRRKNGNEHRSRLEPGHISSEPFTPGIPRWKIEYRSPVIDRRVTNLPEEPPYRSDAARRNFVRPGADLRRDNNSAQQSPGFTACNYISLRLRKEGCGREGWESVGLESLPSDEMQSISFAAFRFFGFQRNMTILNKIILSRLHFGSFRGNFIKPLCMCVCVCVYMYVQR